MFATCVNDVFGVESIQPRERERIFAEAEWLSGIAEAIGCRTMQLCPLTKLQELSYPEAARLTAKNIAKIADIAAVHNVKIQLETIAWSHINSLQKGLDMIDRCERDNIGLSVDFWHFWAPGFTTADELAALDKKLITNVHFCDGKRPQEGEAWDEMLQRAYFPEEGDIPLKEWMDALKSTGFEGCCSAEMVSTRIWQDLPMTTAKRMFDGMAPYL